MKKIMFLLIVLFSIGCANKQLLFSVHLAELPKEDNYEIGYPVYEYGYSFDITYVGKVDVYKDGNVIFHGKNKDLYEKDIKDIEIQIKESLRRGIPIYVFDEVARARSKEIKQPFFLGEDEIDVVCPGTEQFKKCLVPYVLLNDRFVQISNDVGEKYLKKGYYSEINKGELFDSIVNWPAGALMLKVRQNKDNWIYKRVITKPCGDKRTRLYADDPICPIKNL